MQWQPPPHASSPEGELLDSRTAGLGTIWLLRPIPSCSGFWDRVFRRGSVSSFRAGWTNSAAQTNQRRRPILADVTGAEQIYSRLVPMMGVTRFMQQTSFGFKHYRDWLLDKQRLALPGSYVLTWVETEPPAAAVRAECDASVAAGVGTGADPDAGLFCARRRLPRDRVLDDQAPLRQTLPGAEERRLMLKQLDLELQLVDSYLARGNLQGQTEFSLPDPPGTPLKGTKQKGKKSSQPAAPVIGRRPQKRRGDNASPGELEAAIIKTDVGMLLLPIWYGRHAQFVPGQMAANDVKIVVQGIEETAVAWEVTTTGIHTLERKAVAGGHQITLPKFEMTTMVVITSDRREEEKLRKKMEVMRPISARRRACNWPKPNSRECKGSIENFRL